MTDARCRIVMLAVLALMAGVGPGALAGGMTDRQGVGAGQVEQAGAADEAEGGDRQGQSGEVAGRQKDLADRLAEQVARLSRLPDRSVGLYAVRSQLLELNRQSDALAEATTDPQQRLEALNLLAQGQYVQMTRFAEPRLSYQVKSQLRATARRIKALEVPGSAAVGQFWLMAADLYEINHAGLSVKARQDQAAELMSGYLSRFGQAAPAGAVRQALKQLKRNRLAVLMARRAEPVESDGHAERRAIAQVIERVVEALPDDWWVGQMEEGQVEPTGWQRGPGMYVRFERIGRGAEDFRQGEGGLVKLWVMGRRYQPMRTPASQSDGTTGRAVAGELTEWRGRRVYIWGYTAGQWKANAIILQALAETDVPAGPGPESPGGSETASPPPEQAQPAGGPTGGVSGGAEADTPRSGP